MLSSKSSKCLLLNILTILLTSVPFSKSAFLEEASINLTDFVYHAGLESNRFSEKRDRFTYKFWKCVLGF